MPGDPSRTLLPRGGGSPTGVVNTTNLRALLTQQWGLDKPVYVRFGIYLWNLAHGDWGTSIIMSPGSDVWTVINPRLASTLIFTGTATLLSIWVGMRLGLFTGWKRGKFSETFVTMFSLVTYSLPTFWLCLALILAFAVAIPIFPTGNEYQLNRCADGDVPCILIDRIDHLVLPLTAFVVNNYAIFSLIMRNSLTEELSEDYMVTARAKGLSERQQIIRHAVPNARLPVVTVIALYIGWVFSGAIVIEAVFTLNGIGLLTYQAIQARDYPVLSAVFLLGTLGVVVANTILDVLYRFLDPRVREA